MVFEYLEQHLGVRTGVIIIKSDVLTVCLSVNQHGGSY